MESRLNDLPQLQGAVTIALVLLVVAVTAFIGIAIVYARKKKTSHGDDSELSIGCAYFIEVGNRPSQQDSLFVSPLDEYRKFGITAVVADGMGGM